MILCMDRQIQSDIVHRGRLLELEVRSFTEDGRAVTREIVHHPGAVVIVPVCENGDILLIRNERIAVGERLWELPAGTREPGEDPESTARREVAEETGFRAERIDHLASCFTTPGFCDEEIHLYIARDLTEVGQNLDPGEDIEVIRTPNEKAFEMIADGTIRDAKTIAGLLLWDRKTRNDAT